MKILQISIDGYVSLKWPYVGYWPKPFPEPLRRSIIAPYYADCDARFQTTSRVYYQQYYSYQTDPLAQEIIKNATNDVNNFQQRMASDRYKAKYGRFRQVVSNFQASHVIIITWHKMTPYPYWYYWYYWYYYRQEVSNYTYQHTYTISKFICNSCTTKYYIQYRNKSQMMDVLK